MWPFASTELAHIVEHRATRDRLLVADKISGSEAQDLDILSSDVAGIVDGIKQRRWTSTVVVKAFIRSARRSHAQNNFITEVNFTAALERAAELDAEFKRTGKIVGPLHGVPMSLKDQFNIKGLHATVGFSDWIKVGASDEDSSLVKVAQSYGAIFICKTNVPQTMLFIESRNPVFLQTSNPWNKDNVCGGSSGGEAVCLASDASALGIGSDIGGSLRIPAHFCGIYSLKPSHGKWPNKGSIRLVEGFEAIHAVSGPMARSAADLELAHRLYMDALHPREENPEKSAREIQIAYGAEDLMVSPLRPLWFDALSAAAARTHRPKLRFGYYFNDGFTVTSPACIRAVKESKEALERKYGERVELVELPPKELRTADAARLFLALVSADGYRGLRKHIGPDKVDAGVVVPFLVGNLPGFILSIVIFIIRYIIRDPTVAHIVSGNGNKSASKFIDFNSDKKDFLVDFEKRIFDGYQIDGIICPVLPIPAPKHYATTELSAMAASTFLYNVTDSAIAILPVTRVDKDVDFKFGEAWEKTAGTETCSKVSKSLIYGGFRSPARYTPDMHGLPVCVQVIARPHEEEKAIGMMRVLDDALGPRAFGPGYYAREKASSKKVY